MTGPAFAPGRHEGRRHVAAAFLDVEPVVAQQVDVGAGRAVLAPGRLGVAPDLEVEIGKPLAVLVDPVERELLRLVEARHAGVPFP